MRSYGVMARMTCKFQDGQIVRFRLVAHVGGWKIISSLEQPGTDLCLKDTTYEQEAQDFWANLYNTHEKYKIGNL